MKRIGECLRCGNCCRSIVMTVPFGDEESREDYARWYSHHKFVTVYREKGNFNLQVRFELTCKFLIKEKGKLGCKIYRQRPKICRDFPDKNSMKCKGFKFIEEDNDKLVKDLNKLILGEEKNGKD